MTIVPHNMTCSELESPADVILRIDSTHADNIALGIKNHEYRMYQLDDQVKRIWLFVNQIRAITLVITTDTPKTPGEVNDPSGLGNDDFDLGRKQSNFGYPVLALHKLPIALGTEALLRDYGVDMKTRGRQYAKKTLVDAFPLEDLEQVIPK